MKTLVTVLMIAATPIAASRALADAPYAKCLHQGDITQFEPLKGGKALIVTDAFRKQYRIGFRSTCTELNFHTTVMIKTFAGSLSCIRPGDQVLLPDVPGRCFISKVEPYTPDLMAADKADRRPALAAKP